KLSAAPDTKPGLTINFPGHRQLNQLIANFAPDPRLMLAAHTHVGRGFVIGGIQDDPDRVLGARLHFVLDIGDKTQTLLLALPFSHYRHCDEWGVVDLDTDLLDWRDQEVVVAVATDDGGKQPHHRLATDRRAKVVPGPI